MTIDVERVGCAIAGRSWHLAFPADLEARFEADTCAERCRRLIRHNYVGLAIYNAFMLGDWLLIRDIFTVSLCLHLLVMTPIMCLVNATLARSPASRFREPMLAGGILLGTVAILALMLASRSPLRVNEQASIVLVILFATMVQRIRFPTSSPRPSGLSLFTSPPSAHSPRTSSRASRSRMPCSPVSCCSPSSAATISNTSSA